MELEHGREVDVRGCRPEHSSGKANGQGGTFVPDRLGWEAAVIDTSLGPGVYRSLADSRGRKVTRVLYT
jgi:hypothetical protein